MLSETPAVLVFLKLTFLFREEIIQKEKKQDHILEDVLQTMRRRQEAAWTRLTFEFNKNE